MSPENGEKVKPQGQLRISEGVSEDGIPVGNTFDKYNSANPVVRFLMRGFSGSLSALVDRANPKSIHEIGCGEGYWTMQWAEQGYQARGSDFSHQVIELARANADQRGLGSDIFSTRSIYDLDPESDGAELMVCCEVLEHLEEPEAALNSLQRCVSRHLIVSVPREPLWSFMNMARGKYWGDMGNTPGHIQRWSQNAFVTLVSAYFDVVEMRAPAPWTMLLCEPKHSKP